MTAPVGAGVVIALIGPLQWWLAASATVTALAAFLLNVVIWLPAVLILAVLATAGILPVVISILRGRRK
ncbi:MAG: hypothetical protein OXH76_22420 [Boseongicola sp.]|nr:hypothetical protein [Boseongicola sp.]